MLKDRHMCSVCGTPIRTTSNFRNPWGPGSSFLAESVLMASADEFFCVDI